MRRLITQWTASLLSAWTRACLTTSRFDLGPDLAALWRESTPRVFLYWHDDYLLSFLLGMVCEREGMALAAAAANDTIGGEMVQACLAPLGVPLAVLPIRSSREEKLQLLASRINSSRRLQIPTPFTRYCLQLKPVDMEGVDALDDQAVSARLTQALQALRDHSARGLAFAPSTSERRTPGSPASGEAP